MIFDDSADSFLINSGKQSVRNEGDSNIMMTELKGMINELDYTVRHPFMRHFHGYKYHEIAEEMDLPLGTVKSRIFFARKLLKKQLQNRYSLIRAERA